MFELHFDTENAAFDDNRRAEIVRVLRTLAEHLETTSMHEGHLRDVNGNKIGRWVFH